MSKCQEPGEYTRSPTAVHPQHGENVDAQSDCKSPDANLNADTHREPDIQSPASLESNDRLVSAALLQ